MATRRVKRIRRTKKQVHRAHGRKTKHHHKRNHNRITRRHQGGMQAILGAVKLFKGSKLNEKGTTESPTPFDGIEVNYFKKYDTFHLGNGRYTLHDYLSDRSKMDYGEKIQAALNRTNDKIRALSMINQEQVGGTISLKKMNELELTPGQFVYFAAATNSDQRMQELFDRLYPAEAKPAAAAAAAEPELDPKRIVMNARGVQFKGTPQSWNNGKCMFDNYKDTTPFAKVDFVMSRTDRSVRVKFTLPSLDKVAYCALAQYGDHDENNYDLLSPSATLVLSPTSREANEKNWDVTLPIDTFYTKFLQYFDYCKTGTGFNERAYKFYQERNQLISTLFFEKPPSVEHNAQVLLNVSNNNLNAATELIAAQPDSVLSSTEKEILNVMIENFKSQLSANVSNIAELKRLDEEITLFVKDEITKLLLQARKAAAMTGMDALAGRMSGLTPTGVARRPPSSSSSSGL